MDTPEQNAGQAVPGTEAVGIGVAVEGPLVDGMGQRVEASTDADVGGVAIQHLSGDGDPSDAAPAAIDHKSMLHDLLAELAHVEHMGKSEIAAVLAKFRALV